jgi:hypothetical protein
VEQYDAIALASRIVGLVATNDLQMGLITGSVARGLSDEASDLDIYLYWDRVDLTDLAEPHRFDAIGARVAFGIPTASGWFTKLDHDGRYIDVESVDATLLEHASHALAAGGAPAGWVVELAAGLRDAIALHGSGQLVVWQQRFRYRDEWAAAEVTARAARLVSPTALFELTDARGDTLSFTARLSQVLLDAVALLGAVNRRFIPVDEPKWIPWHLRQLTHHPRDVDQRIHDALTHPSADTMADLDALLDETLDLVDTHVPGTATRTARYAISLRPRPAR